VARNANPTITQRIFNGLLSNVPGKLVIVI
jgi:hypothetical protein